ncbi:hypothetical protein AS589_00145 [Empedobacter brevis]|nr:hypothetical protein AS589_00145 [Empedobacter brevis]
MFFIVEERYLNQLRIKVISKSLKSENFLKTIFYLTKYQNPTFIINGLVKFYLNLFLEKIKLQRNE